MNSKVKNSIGKRPRASKSEEVVPQTIDGFEVMGVYETVSVENLSEKYQVKEMDKDDD